MTYKQGYMTMSKCSIATIFFFIFFTASNVVPIFAEDYNILVWTWQPTFCTQEKECEDVVNQFTIHGLWPSSSTNSSVENCSNESLSSSSLSSRLTSELNCDWPALGPTMSQDQNYGFWSYQWKKHGTCSSLSQEDYFSTALDLSSRYNPDAVFADNNLVNTSRSYSQVDLYDLKDMFTEAWDGITPMISCNDGTYLYEVWMCVDDNMQPMAKCPSGVRPRGCNSKEMLEIPIEGTVLSAPNCPRSSGSSSTSSTTIGTGTSSEGEKAAGNGGGRRLFSSCVSIIFAICVLLI